MGNPGATTLPTTHGWCFSIISWEAKLLSALFVPRVLPASLGRFAWRFVCGLIRQLSPPLPPRYSHPRAAGSAAILGLCAREPRVQRSELDSGWMILTLIDPLTLAFAVNSNRKRPRNGSDISYLDPSANLHPHPKSKSKPKPLSIWDRQFLARALERRVELAAQAVEDDRLAEEELEQQRQEREREREEAGADEEDGVSSKPSILLLERFALLLKKD